MKKIIFICLMSFYFASFAQQTPKEIHDILKYLKEEVQPREDNFYDTAYVRILEQIKTQSGVNQAIWNSCMADLLNAYLDENQYRILERTKIEGNAPSDFNTWDLQTFVQQIVFYYFKSIENKELLQKQSIDTYKVLLQDADQSVIYRPTVYDMLAHRALEFLSKTIYRLPIPLVAFDLNNLNYFADNETFINTTITTPDSLSFHFHTLNIIQELTKFHLHAENFPALIDITLKRINYVLENSSLENREELYLNSLNTFEKTYKDKLGYEDICYALGEYFNTRASKYNLETAPEYRQDYIQALQWYKKAITIAPKSLAAINAVIRIEKIKTPSISFSYNYTVTPNQQHIISYNYKNTDKIYGRIIPISTDNYDRLGWDKKVKYEKIVKLKYSHQFEVTLKNHNDYQTYAIDEVLPSLPIGSYMILISLVEFTKENTLGYAEKLVIVSNINALSRNNPENIEFLFFNRTTGTPFKNMEVTSYYERYNNTVKYEKKQYKTDEYGKVFVPINESYNQLIVEGNNEYGSFKKNTYTYSRNSDRDIESENIYLFTDRAIYRPGQTVFFKGIVITSKNKNYKIVPDKEVEVIFKDANGQEIKKIKLTSNEYGSFSSSFEIPANGLSGNFTLSCLNSTHSIVVEEYKRPQFEVIINEPQTSYKLSEKVDITGKALAYSGYPIDEAKVSYRVVRNASFPYWFRWYPQPTSSEQEIAQGNLITDSEGSFVFDFIALEDKTVNRLNPVYTYTITVDVSDINGETQTQTSSIRIGNKSLLINIDFPEAISLEHPKEAISITTKNLNGQFQPANFTCRIVQLEMPQGFLHEKPTEKNSFEKNPKLKDIFPYLAMENENDKTTWKIKEEKYHANIQSEGEYLLPIPMLNNYKEGYYKIIIKGKDTYGQEVETEKYFFVYKEKSTQCVAYEALWVHCNQSSAEVGDEINVYIGSYLPSANIYFEVISNDTILHTTWLNVKQGVTSYSMKIKEEHRGFLAFSAFLCDQNTPYVKTHRVNVPFTNKMIDFEFITFRDKLLPGAKEEWKIKIKDKEGKKLSGELLCSMYDASLDAFRENNFNFRLNHLNHLSLKNTFSLDIYNYRNSYFYSLYNSKFGYQYLGYQQREYYCFNHELEIRNSRTYCYGIAEKSSDVGSLRFDMDESNAIESESDQIKSETTKVPSSNDKEIVPDKTPLPRTNFAETAFFFPQLQTDKNGNVIFSFTMPESLTKWKFQGVAHTKDLRTGTFEKFVQTQKELMIVPNAPRFLREGDTLVFSAKVVNMSDKKLSGMVSLELFNAQNNEKLSIIPSYKEQAFTTSKGMSQEVQFTLAIPKDVAAITYRIMATTHALKEGNATFTYSDGEEKILPVLTNRMLVTETLPLPINGEENKTFTFKEMKNTSPTLTHHKLTLEFTSNPVWYAIQALPYMMEYPYDCNEQVFSRMYANTIATHIANSSPKIKEVFESWKNMSPDAFCSNLEKNQELKSLVLEETPWVMDANTENANKQRVGLLFDIQRMAKENEAAVNKLEKNQNSDGSWAWFAGGRGSCYITQHLVAGFGHLQQLNIKSSLNENTLRKAIHYLDDEITRDYNELKRRKEISNVYIGYTNLHYLYARSFHLNKYPVSAPHKEAYDFFLTQTKKAWKESSIYMQALTALTLYRNGETELAQTIMENIKKRAQYSEELGMYWKKEGYGYYWHEAPIERQAILIEAFNEITKDEISVEKMKTYLLKQKQTQNWGTTRATTEACYALLINNQQLLSADEQAVIIKVGKHNIDVSKVPDKEAGTGYFKTSWLANEITDDMANITVKKPSKGVAWGGMYWQYFENLDKIVQNKDIPHVLSLRKSLYKVSLDDRGETLTAITEDKPLKVGDKVRVRVEIRVDRDMEYVHLKDMRASSFEPTQVLSKYKYQDGLYYYESTRDASTNFFIDYLPKGTYVFEYTVIATQAGTFSNGISTIQCMYAPEFSEHSEGIRIIVR